MPELPEVETVRRMIEPIVVGQTITAISVNPAFPGVLEAPVGVEPVGSITGARITHAERRGKYLLLPLSTGMWLIIHLRMTGRLLLLERDAPSVRFQHLALHLDNGMDLRFGDQRKFGRVVLSVADDALHLDSRLGPEPFDRTLTGASLHDALRTRTGKIKAALLDQALIAGLGNIYVDEALFRARIHPERTARELSPDDVARLLRAIRHVLTSALENQGTTFSTFENPYGEAGSNANFLRVYGKGRSALPCPRCGRSLAHTVVAGRGTTYCPHCQAAPGHRPGAADHSSGEAIEI